MDANKAFQIIEKAFSDKRLVLVTDGTVTRRVVSVGLAEKLYIHTEAGGWVEIKRSFCGLTLEGWGLLDAAEALYIAPDGGLQTERMTRTEETKMYERRRRRSKTRSQVMLQQRLMGLLLVVLSVVMLIVCAHGTTIEDRDGTGAFMMLPMGLYLIFTKKICIYW